MKSKLFLAAAMLAVLVLTSCEQKESKQVDYYIFEHVEGGANWEKMTYKYGLYTYTGKYFGGSISIGSKPGAWDHHWTDPATIEGYNSLVGEDYWWLHGGLEVTFTFDESSLSMKQINIPQIYYIKHTWGSSADEDWTWQKMTKSGSNYVYDGLWGGIGANINTVASDDGALWFPVSEINGAASLSIGDGVKFTYSPSTSTLSAKKTSSGTLNSKSQVRFCKEKDYTYVTYMSIDEFDADNKWVKAVAEHQFGTDEGTTEYYEILAGRYYPMYYFDYTDDEHDGYYYGLDTPYYFTFGAGKRYTYICSDDGEYLVFTVTLDGSFNAPAKHEIVARGRILKSEMQKMEKIKE